MTRQNISVNARKKVYKQDDVTAYDTICRNTSIEEKASQLSKPGRLHTEQIFLP